MTEEALIAGSELVDYIKRSVAEGNVRRVIIRKAGGEILLEVSPTVWLSAVR